MKLASEILEPIHQCFTNFFQTQKTPGLAYAITRSGRVMHSAAFGAQRLTPNQPMTTDSLSRIASMTKSFAAVAALRLRDAGLLDIDIPISSISKQLKLAEPLATASIRSLMAMKLDLVTDDPWADRLLGATNEEIDPHFNKPLLRAGLGSFRCAYSNLSYFLLGRIISIVTGRPLMEYISEEITAPLGMHDTVWNPSEQLQRRVALGYRADYQPPREEEYYICRSDAAAFGGLWSTVSDLAIWLEFLRVAEGSPAAWESVLCSTSRLELSYPYASYDGRPFESTITGHALENRAWYGFGVVRSMLAGMETLAHSGGLPGYGSHMRVDFGAVMELLVSVTAPTAPLWTPCADSLLHVLSSLKTENLINTEGVVEVGNGLAQYIISGASEEKSDLFTHNFWRDNPRDLFVTNLRLALSELGPNLHVRRINCSTGYQGEITFSGELGERTMAFQLAPHLPAHIQHVGWV